MESLELRGNIIVEHSRHISGDGINHNHRRKLPACQNIVTDGDIIRHNHLKHTLINALIMSAQEYEVILLRKFTAHLMVKALSLRCHVENPDASLHILAYMLICLIDRLRLHDHPGTSAIRVIVHLQMLVRGEIPDIRCTNLYYVVLYRPSDDAGVKPIEHHIRKKRKHMKINHKSSNPSMT